MKAKSGRTNELHLLAQQNGNVTEKFKELANQYDLNETDEGGRTPLYLATRYGHDKLVEFLLATKKVNLSLADNQSQPHPTQKNKLLAAGQTPLHIALLYGFSTIAEKLIAAGANSYESDDAGRSPLELYLDLLVKQIVQSLPAETLETLISQNKQLIQAFKLFVLLLKASSESQQQEISKKLLDKLTRNIFDITNYRALEIWNMGRVVIAQENSDLYFSLYNQQLKEFLDKLNKWSNKLKLSIWLVVDIQLFGDSFEKLISLFNPESLDPTKKELPEKMWKILNYLKELLAIKEEDKKIIISKSPSCVVNLSRLRALFTEQEQPRPTLHQLAAQGDVEEFKKEFVKLVNHKKYNPNQKNESGCTLFHIAIQAGHIGIIEFLLTQEKVDPALVDNYNQSALELCLNLLVEKIVPPPSSATSASETLETRICQDEQLIQAFKLFVLLLKASSESQQQEISKKLLDKLTGNTLAIANYRALEIWNMGRIVITVQDSDLHLALYNRQLKIMLDQSNKELPNPLKPSIWLVADIKLLGNSFKKDLAPKFHPDKHPDFNEKKFFNEMFPILKYINELFVTYSINRGQIKDSESCAVDLTQLQTLFTAQHEQSTNPCTIRRQPAYR